MRRYVGVRSVACEARLTEGEARLVDREVCGRACRHGRLAFHQAALGSLPHSRRDPAMTIDFRSGGTANLLAVDRW